MQQALKSTLWLALIQAAISLVCYFVFPALEQVSDAARSWFSLLGPMSSIAYFHSYQWYGALQFYVVETLICLGLFWASRVLARRYLRAIFMALLVLSWLFFGFLNVTLPTV